MDNNEPVKDGKSPGYWFYPGDFERDLAGVSLAAQGLWMRMLGWMHQNEAHRGFLELPNGEPMTERQIALRIGRSVREVRPLIDDLKNFGVFSIAPSGAVYCRRMARETHIGEVRRAAAKSRADKATREANGTFAGASQPKLLDQSNQQSIHQNGSKTPTVSDSVSDSVSASIKDICASVEARDGDSFSLSPEEKKQPDPRIAWFAEFWEAYKPIRSRAKQDALKAFMGIVKTEAVFHVVMAAVAAQMPELLAREPEHRPYAASWLRGRRFEDEVAEAATPKRSDALAALYAELEQNEKEKDVITQGS